MRVDFYGTQRDLTGIGSVQINAPAGLTVRQLVDLLADLYPQLRDILMNDQSRLYDHVPLFVNGRNPRLLPEGLDTPLDNQDVVSLFSVISVGRMSVEALKGSESPGERQER